MSADPTGANAAAAVAARTRIIDEADARQLPALIAWERVTGRPHPSPARVLPVAPRARRWKIEEDATWGSVTLVSEQRRVSIASLDGRCFASLTSHCTLEDR
jgi:hypothetical protein